MRHSTTRIHLSASRGERGYAMLMVMLMATMLLVAATAVSVNHLTEGRRQREEELAWRGNQYVRAIRLYFKKNGRFPKSLEDLTKYTSDQPRYIRKAYKDPMDTEDKGWRLIYVTPNGILIGSLMHKTLYAGGLPGPPVQGQPPGAPSSAFGPAPGSTFGPSPGSTTPPGGMQPPGGSTPPGSAGGTAQQPTQPGQPDTNQPGQGGGTSPGTGTGPMMGGQLIGVASYSKRDSIRVCQGGTTYFLWEFIWDPTAPGQGNDPCAPPNALAGPAPGTGTNPGQTSPAGPGTGTGPNPPQNPPAGPGTGSSPPQNPPQN